MCGLASSIPRTAGKDDDTRDTNPDSGVANDGWPELEPELAEGLISLAVPDALEPGKRYEQVGGRNEAVVADCASRFLFKAALVIGSQELNVRQRQKCQD